jgi:hypothetical protein
MAVAGVPKAGPLPRGIFARRLREFSCVMFGLLASAPAAAQSLGSAPRVEVGAEVLGLGGYLDVSDFVGDPQFGLVGAGVLVRASLARRVALEARVGVSSVEQVGVNVYDVSVIVRRAPPALHAWTTFLRFGAGGRREVEQIAERRHENLDRSITVYPGYTRYRVTRPNFAVVGVGLQRAIAKGAALAADVDAIGGAVGVGLRLSAGVTIPLGAYGGR